MNLVDTVVCIDMEICIASNVQSQVAQRPVLAYDMKVD